MLQFQGSIDYSNAKSCIIQGKKRNYHSKSSVLKTTLKNAIYLQNEGSEGDLEWRVHLQRCLDNETSLLTHGILKEVHR